MQAVHSLNELREQGKMTWSERERGWVAAPAEILNALGSDGFEACKRESPYLLLEERRPGNLEEVLLPKRPEALGSAGEDEDCEHERTIV